MKSQSDQACRQAASGGERRSTRDGSALNPVNFVSFLLTPRAQPAEDVFVKPTFTPSATNEPNVLGAASTGAALLASHFFTIVAATALERIAIDFIVLLLLLLILLGLLSLLLLLLGNIGRFGHGGAWLVRASTSEPCAACWSPLLSPRLLMELQEKWPPDCTRQRFCPLLIAHRAVPRML